MTINLATGRLEPVSDSYTHLDEWNPWLSPIKIDRKFKGYLGDSPTSGPPNKIRFRNLKSTTDNHNHSHWKSPKKWKCSSEIIYKWVKQCHLHHPPVITIFVHHSQMGDDIVLPTWYMWESVLCHVYRKHNSHMSGLSLWSSLLDLTWQWKITHLLHDVSILYMI